MNKKSTLDANLTFYAIEKAILDGQDNPKLFERVKGLGERYLENKKIDRGYLDYLVLLNVFHKLDDGQLTQQQINHYEQLLLDVSSWLKPSYEQIGASRLVNLFRDLYKESTYRLFVRLMPMYIRGFDINKTANANGMTLLQEACDFIPHPTLKNDVLADGLIKWAGADIHQPFKKYGKALHLISGIQKPEDSIKLFDVMVKHGADIHEELNYVPWNGFMKERCVNYVDYLDRVGNVVKEYYGGENDLTKRHAVFVAYVRNTITLEKTMNDMEHLMASNQRKRITV